MDERMGTLLKRARARIDRGKLSLGPYLRVQTRIEEEVAETVGITREWYAMMETDRPVRVSASVLAAISDALMMAADERTALFRLAIPELRSASLSENSEALTIRDVTPATVETYVSYLRSKVDVQGAPLIHTLRGVGYTMRLKR